MVRMGDEVTVLLDIGLFCRFAAAHTSEAVMDRWEVVKVSTQVAFQTNKLPFDQGAMVIPSGCLPSARSRPGLRNIGRGQSPVQNVIKHGMAEVTTSTKTTTEPVSAKHVHI